MFLGDGLWETMLDTILDRGFFCSAAKPFIRASSFAFKLTCVSSPKIVHSYCTSSYCFFCYCSSRASLSSHWCLFYCRACSFLSSFILRRRSFCALFYSHDVHIPLGPKSSPERRLFNVFQKWVPSSLSLSKSLLNKLPLPNEFGTFPSRCLGTVLVIMKQRNHTPNTWTFLFNETIDSNMRRRRRQERLHMITLPRRRRRGWLLVSWSIYYSLWFTKKDSLHVIHGSQKRAL